MLDTVVKVNKNYCPQTLLRECKNETKKNKMENLINDDNESDNESNNEFGKDKFSD